MQPFSSTATAMAAAQVGATCDAVAAAARKLIINAGFSAEPTIAIYGEFGMRLEDCLHITENGRVLFTQQSPSVEQPFA